MNKEKLLELIKKGENTNVEFKESKNGLSKNVFETICAFLNRNGGHLLLGVQDNGSIQGIEENKIDKIIDNLVTQVNNPQKLSPPFYLYPQIFDIEGKKIIYIYVPQSSQVHNTNGKIFDRNRDGDFDVTNNGNHIAQLYLIKQNTYTENSVYPYAELADLNISLLKKARLLAKNESGGHHLWSEMDDMQLLKNSGLYKKDFQTGKEGITLAGILLFGKDETILNALPHHATDAILRIHNLDRYDDRDDIRTNLIDTYYRLMAFAEKHLPDPFYLENNTRVSLRGKILREAISNIIIHREYSNAYTAKMIIENTVVTFENANRPHSYGYLAPDSFTPLPKNPIIAKIFKEIGFADELGSGVRNLFKYTPIYSNGKQPQFIEDDIFKIIIPLPEDVVTKGEDVVTKGEDVVTKGEDVVTNKLILQIIDSKFTNKKAKTKKRLHLLLLNIFKNEGKRLPFYANKIMLAGSDRNIQRYMEMLKKEGLIEFRGKSKKTGGYFIKNKQLFSSDKPKTDSRN